MAAISGATEVLITTSDGVLHTLSLPSGVVRSVPAAADNPNFFQGQPFVVAPDAAALTVPTGLLIVPRDGSVVITVDADRFGNADGGGLQVAGWKLTPDGTTRFLVVSFGIDGSDFHSVGVDGSVETEDDDATSIARSFSTIRPPDGATFVNDASGVYAIIAMRPAQTMSHSVNGNRATRPSPVWSV